MALLLKKVWGSVLNRSGSTSSRSSSELSPGISSLGAFDQLPIDILMQIIRLASPKDAARMSVLCKSWRIFVSDNMIWIFFLTNGRDAFDSVVFAETRLRLGFSCLSDATMNSRIMWHNLLNLFWSDKLATLQDIYRKVGHCSWSTMAKFLLCCGARITVRAPVNQQWMYFEYSTQLSFMNIYAQREKVPGSVIIDGGSGYCKYGWSKYDSPSGRCATFLEFGNIESPMYSKLRHFFSTIYTRMQVKPSSQPTIVSIPICHSDDTEAAQASRKQLKEAIHTVLFDMNAPAVCAIDQAVLALYAARCTSGIVINIGFHATSIVPILQGRVMREVGVEVVGVGALKLTGYLKELMQQRNIAFESSYTVRTIKEKLCYVATDYNLELHKDTHASCEVSGEGSFTLSKERFQAAEILFQPQIAGVRALGLHRALALCMDHCAEAELADDGWFKTVVLAGGTACLPGLPERIEKEIQKLLPSSISEGMKVIPPQYGVDSAWFGAKIVGNVSTFSEAWCVTKKQFRQKSRGNTPAFLGPWYC